jgi:septation ring formation regulator EzrA
MTSDKPDTTIREDIKQRLEHALQDLEQQRDELRVRLHLGKADAQDEWERMRVKLDELKVRLARGADEAGDTAEKFETAMKAALEELRIGLQKARDHF